MYYPGAFFFLHHRRIYGFCQHAHGAGIPFEAGHIGHMLPVVLYCEEQTAPGRTGAGLLIASQKRKNNTGISMQTRLDALRAALRAHELEALLITNAANRRYISGFSGSAGVLLVTDDDAVLLTDFRYRSRAAQEAPAFRARETSSEQSLPKLLAATAVELGVQQIGFEAQHVSVARFTQFTKAIEETDAPVKPNMPPTEGIVEALREVKDSDELALLRRAIAITDDAFAAVVPTLTPQHSERQAAWMLEAAMRERGAEAISFPIIVAAGRNAASPHAQAGEALLGSGQPIVIDMGARYAGYHADLTRTIVLGDADARFWNIYGIVYEAQQQAIAHIHAGISGPTADALARDPITAAGFGETFGHSLGHGVGLDVHEGPTLARTSEHTLRPGNVFSIEPGIYLEDWGGVRIEDLALLSETGCEVLSQAPKLRQP
jgi:Xaa-Pro aminopeptidase